MVADAEPERVEARRRRGVGAAIVVVIVALSATILIGIARGAGAPVETVAVTPGSLSTGAASPSAHSGDGGPGVEPPPASVFVHVSGAVTRPGLYVLADGARVVDAVSAAGGFADGAAADAVNLARGVGDGEQLHVPRQGEEPEPAARPSGDGRVNLNTADEALLDTLPRIGPALAARIVQWREANGRFTSVDDLLAVSGIGDKMLETLRDLVTV